MAELSQLDKTFNFILRYMRDNGPAPHYSEIAAELGVSVEEGRKALHTLIDAGVPGWLFPGTDLLVSMAPFNNLPNQYKISVDGEQKWYGQCAFESLAMCWMFPGKTIQIDSVCLDCGESIQVKVKDGEILGSDPEGIIGHVSVPLPKWFENMAYA